MFFIKQILRQMTLTLLNSAQPGEVLAGGSESSKTQAEKPADWMKLLTPEQKQEIDALVAMRMQLKEETRFDNLDITDVFPEGFEGLSFEEKKDMLVREIDMYKRLKEKKRLEIYLMENKPTIENRHGFVENMFDTTDPKLREGLIGKSLNTLTAGDIYSMQQAGADLAELFLITESGELVSKSTMSEGDKYKVNFGKCKSADRIIGIGDIIDIENVSQIKVNGVTGTRGYDPRPGYYSQDGKYLAVHDGYKIEIVQKNTIAETEKENLTTAIYSRYEQTRSRDIQGLVYGMSEANQELPITQEHDVALLQSVFVTAGIEGVSYDRETKKLSFPDGLDFSDTKEIMSGYRGVRKAIVEFISTNDPTSNAQGEKLVLKDLGYSSSLVQKALESMVGKNGFQGMTFDVDTLTLTTTDGKTIQDKLGGGYEYLGTGTAHLMYMPELQRASLENDVPLGSLITLIYKENDEWNTRASPGGSSALGLGQMIDGTWKRFGNGLNRYDAEDQLIATTRYMRYIKDYHNCPWEHVLAYYNTGEGIKNVSQEKIKEYGRLNYGAITIKIPSGIPLTHESYFTAAVAYYNSISYEQASLTI